jgi:two-component system chemotaxis response regulator CheB
MTNSCELLLIGGSAGSLEILLEVLPALKTELPFAIVIVIHRKSSFNSTLTELLASKTTIPTTEAEEKDQIMPSRIYIAPGDYHLMIEANKTFSLDSSEKVNYSRPSIDLTFQTGAEAYEDKLVCLLLSGANTDGTEGLYMVKDLGGKIAVQDPAEANSPLMPVTALKSMQVDRVLKNNEISAFINNLGSRS